MKLIFCRQIGQTNTKDFFKLMYHNRCVAKHVYITQNSKFAISLQYSKKQVSDRVYFLHADEHENFPQIYSMIFDGNSQAFPKFSK